MLKLRDANDGSGDVWLVEPGVKVGRLASNDLVLDSPGTAECEFEIRVKGEHLLLHNRVPHSRLTVNEHPVVDGRVLRENDLIQLNDRQWRLVDPKKFVSSVGRPESLWALKAKGTTLGSRVYPLQSNTMLGRANECDISLAVTHLSRRHARLYVRHGLLYVQDLESVNGTYLNGRRISEARVRRGDELRFDTLTFGVIGPPDELGRTRIRPMFDEPAGTAARDNAHGDRRRPVRVRHLGSKSAATGLFVDAVRPPRHMDGQTPVWLVLWLVLLLLVLLALGFTYHYL